MDLGYYYSPVLILQGFCLFHAYKNNHFQKYYWLIIFVPLVGSLIYLYLTFFSGINARDITEGIKQIVNSNYQVDKLEKENRFTGTISNKKALADEYMNKGRVEDAIGYYNACLQGIYVNDTDINRKLVKAYYLKEDYENCIKSGLIAEKSEVFVNSEERALWAWAYYFLGDIERSELLFKSMDRQFSNYFQRLEYAKFLMHIGKSSEGISKLQKMMEEIDFMDSYEKRLKRNVYKEIKSFYQKSVK